LDNRGEQLDVDAFFDTGGSAGKTRLSIISTKFLKDNATVEFWVARLLVEVARWTSKHPSESLQAVLMFDEADMYLPAQRKPATKEPMENLLKRARSAGLGLLLATQNPGDFDYKFRENIGTWFVGQIKEQRSVEKLKSMLDDCRANIASKLPGQQTGDFYLLHSGETVAIQSRRSILETAQLPETAIVALARKTQQQ
jgi:DNA helicase HerA-like ATPase